MKNRLRKLTIYAITILLCMIMSFPAFAAPTVNLDGQQLSFDVPPVIENGRTLVPLRTIFESLGAEVKWDEAYHTVTATKRGSCILLMVGERTGYIDGKAIPLEVESKLINGKTMVPLRFVCESLGTEVQYDQKNQIININSKDKAHPVLNDTLSWERIYDMNYWGEIVQQTDDGGFLIAGENHELQNTYSNIFILKTDENGTIQWNRTAVSNGGDLISCVCRTMDGGFIFGCKFNGIAYLLKLDSKGQFEWDTDYYDELNCIYVNSLDACSDGGYVLLCNTSDGNKYGKAIIKVDNTGKIISKAIYEKSSYYPEYVKQCNQGYIIAGEYDDVPTDTYCTFVRKIDTRFETVWEKKFIYKNNAPVCIQEEYDNSYTILGNIRSEDNIDIYVFKIDCNGNILWDRHFDRSKDDQAYFLQQSKDGGYIICGETRLYDPYMSAGYLLKLNKNGQKEWEKAIGSELGGTFKYVQQTSDGGYILTGFKMDKLVLVKTDSDGNVYYKQYIPVYGEMGRPEYFV